MAPVAFAAAYGSFGDIVETIKLVPKVVELIRNGGESLTGWAETEKELTSLHSELTHLQILRPMAPFQQFIDDRIHEEGRLCLSIIKDIHSKIVSRNIVQKIRGLWANSEEKELAAFRINLIQRRTAISGIVGQINLWVRTLHRKGTTDGDGFSATLSLVRHGVAQVQDSAVQVGEQIRQIQDSVGAVSRQIGDQDQTLSSGLPSLRDRVDMVSQEVRLGNDQIQTGVIPRLKDHEETLNHSRISELKSKLQEWLKSPPEMAEKQHEAQKLHHQGTGKWFLDGPAFVEWKEKPGFLWMTGQSGTGKTIMSSVVIRKLFDDPQRFAEGTAVAYFYFDFRDNTKRLVEVMLRCIILQLSAQSPSPYKALDRVHESSKGQTLPTYENLLDVLQVLLSELGRTYIVLDALDECKEPNLLVQLVSWFREKDTPLHVLLAGQPREIFVKAFEGVPQVFLDCDMTYDDIFLFVANELRSNPDLEHLTLRAEDITTKVVEKSNGMFRLARCLLDELSRRKLDPDVGTVLENLPGDLFGIYSRFLEHIHHSDFQFVAKVLRWLVFSAEPVTLPQLMDTLAFDFSNPKRYIFDPAKRGGQAVGVLKLLQGLVIVSEPPNFELTSETDSEDEAVESRFLKVTLAHASVADYIQSHEFRDKHNHDLGPGPSHIFLAQSCLGYLLHFADHPLDETTIFSYPLSIYAAQYWSYHLLCCRDRAVLMTSITSLLENGNRIYAALNDWLFDPLPIRPQPPPCVSATPEAEFANITHRAVDRGSNSSSAQEIGKVAASQWASKNDRMDIVQLLHALQTGAEHGRGLHDALANCCFDLVRLLLEKGADVNAAGEYYGTALSKASSEGYTDVVRLLLAEGADVDAEDTEFGNALRVASEGGHAEIVRLLLDQQAKIDADDGDGTALEVAAAQGDTEIVLALLEENQDQTEDDFYGTALQAACGEGHMDIVELLLEHGANVNAKAGDYGSPLLAACALGDVEIVALLIENEADVNVKDEDGENALEVASQGGHINIVKLLLEKNADIHAIGEFCGSALQAASQGGHLELVELLLENKADVNAVGGQYGGALQAAIEGGHVEVVQLLLEKDADVNEVGGQYGSPLIAASQIGYTDIVRLLLDKDADPNAANEEYGSALQAASEGGHLEIVQLLLKNGAQVNQGGGLHGSALQAASGVGHKEVVQLLLDNGGEVNSTGGHHGSPLRAAFKGGNTDIVQLLLDKGAKENVLEE